MAAKIIAEGLRVHHSEYIGSSTGDRSTAYASNQSFYRIAPFHPQRASCESTIDSPQPFVNLVKPFQ